MRFLDFGDLDSYPLAGTRWRKGRKLLYFVSTMDTIVIKCYGIFAVNESLGRLCRYWHRELRRLQTDVSFMDAAGCVDTMSCAFWEQRACTAVL